MKLNLGNCPDKTCKPVKLYAGKKSTICYGRTESGELSMCIFSNSFARVIISEEVAMSIKDRMKRGTRPQWCPDPTCMFIASGGESCFGALRRVVHIENEGRIEYYSLCYKSIRILANEYDLIFLKKVLQQKEELGASQGG
ncbi:MAG: hypothetical protein JZD41_02090 [Thermoproteus sp.]|nr:hypothetical protein [Thermoproteus sp.]